jgi:ABC-type glycerol-3-phosphate transport system permease component
MDPAVTPILPAPGLPIYPLYLVVPREAAQKELAVRYIDFIATPEVQAKAIVERFGWYPGVDPDKVLGLISPKSRDLLFKGVTAQDLARYSRQMPLKDYHDMILLAFLLPQAFPQLPVFASATREFYRWGLAGTIPGVVLVHLVGGLGFAVWTMTAVFRAIAPELEEAAHNLGASVTRGFLTVSLPLAVPGLVASAVLVFLYSLDEFTGTLLVGAPFVTTLPVYMYTASVGYELQIASVTALVLMVPGAMLLLVLERFLKAEYLAFLGQV